MPYISNVKDFVQSRKGEGKTREDIQNDLIEVGYDDRAARWLTMLYYETESKCKIIYTSKTL